MADIKVTNRAFVSGNLQSKRSFNAELIHQSRVRTLKMPSQHPALHRTPVPSAPVQEPPAPPATPEYKREPQTRYDPDTPTPDAATPVDETALSSAQAEVDALHGLRSRSMKRARAKGKVRRIKAAARTPKEKLAARIHTKKRHLIPGKDQKK